MGLIIALYPYLRLTHIGLIVADQVAQIRTGIERLVYESRPADSGIALYYSRPSEHVCTAWQAIQGTNDKAKALNPGRIQFSFLTPTLKFADRGWRSVAYGQVANGILKENKIKLLILPFAQAISTQEVEEIRNFVRNGSTVLADIRPAMSDQHGYTGAAGLLDDVFGVKHDPAWSAYAPQEGQAQLNGAYKDLKLDLQFGPVLLGPAVKPAGATALGKSGETPLVLVNEFGKGKAILLNFSMAGLGTQTESVCRLFDNLLMSCGIPKILADVEVSKALGSDGKPIWTAAPAGNVRYINGGIDIIGVWFTTRRGIGTQHLSITLPRPGHVYDLQSNKYLNRHDKLEVEIPLEGLGVYAVAPYRIEAPRLEVKAGRTKDGKPCFETQVQVNPKEAAAERHVVRIRLFAPDGTEWRDFAVNVIADKGIARQQMVLPLNAPSGNWKVQAREAISGLSHDCSVALQP